MRKQRLYEIRDDLRSMDQTGEILKNTQPIFALVVILAVVLAGCESGTNLDDMVAKATDTNIKRVTKMYSICMKANGWKGPADTEALQDFIQRQNPDQLRAMGIEPDNLPALFLSERDQKPFKIRWAVQGSMLSPPLPIIFESSPNLEGIYQIGFTGSSVQEVKQPEYDRFWEGAGDDLGPDPVRRR